tara:strand:- start:611 stop:802 length:192 start_codon:yes stop_codon:yes gene_type:complete
MRTGISIAMLATSTAALAEEIWITGTPLGRRGQPEDVAYGVLFLASDESSFMTGSGLGIGVWR